MAELKTKLTNASVPAFIRTVSDERKRKDGFALLKLFKDITGETPKMWGTSIIGFGKYHYKSLKSAQEGDWMITGFSPRKQNLTLYVISGFKGLEPLLKKLGKHTVSGGSCLYINKLEDVSLPVLKQIIKKSYGVMKKRYTVKR